MRPCNKYQTPEITRNFNSGQPFRWVNERQSDLAKSQHVLYFFMSHSTCSHCWKQAMALSKFSDYFAAHNTTILLVGDGRYEKAAKKLVNELNLPMRYVADNGALRRYYHIDAPEGQKCGWILLFVDTHGATRFCQSGCQNQSTQDFAPLLFSIRTADTADREHIMAWGRSQVNGCEKQAKVVSQ